MSDENDAESQTSTNLTFVGLERNRIGDMERDTYKNTYN